MNSTSHGSLNAASVRTQAFDQILGRAGDARLADDVGLHDLAAVRVGHADDDGVGHGGVAEDQLLDVAGRPSRRRR